MNLRNCFILCLVCLTLQITRRPKLLCRLIAQCQKFAAVLKPVPSKTRDLEKHGGILFIKNRTLTSFAYLKLQTQKQIGSNGVELARQLFWRGRRSGLPALGGVDLLVRHFHIFYFHFTFCILNKGKNKIINMNKPRFSLQKAKKTVEISSKIEGHKIQSRKPTNQRKKTSSKTKN